MVNGSPPKQTQWAPQLDNSSSSFATVPRSPADGPPLSPSHRLRQKPAESGSGRGHDVSSTSDGEVSRFLHDIRDDISALHTTVEAAAKAASLAASKASGAQNIAARTHAVAAQQQHLQTSPLVRQQQDALERLRAEVAKMQEAMEAHEQSVPAVAAVAPDTQVNKRSILRPRRSKQSGTNLSGHTGSSEQWQQGASEHQSPETGRVVDHHAHDVWKEGYDAVRGKRYWYNLRTKETRWQDAKPQIAAERDGRGQARERGTRSAM